MATIDSLNEGDFVLCTVKSVERTEVFVDIEEIEGEIATIPISEIAAGRIRNLRDYVVPNKKIVCKVLRINPSGTVILSLRRVNQKERKEVLEIYQREKTSKEILRAILKEKTNEVYLKILAGEGKKLVIFFQETLENPKPLEKYVTKSDAESILKILKEKSEKEHEKEIRKQVSLKSTSSSGLKDIKELLGICKECHTSYLGGGNYLLRIKAKDFKIADQKISKELGEIEKKAKEKKVELEIKNIKP